MYLERSNGMAGLGACACQSGLAGLGLGCDCQGCKRAGMRGMPGGDRSGFGVLPIQPGETAGEFVARGGTFAPAPVQQDTLFDTDWLPSLPDAAGAGLSIARAFGLVPQAAPKPAPSSGVSTGLIVGGLALAAVVGGVAAFASRRGRRGKRR